MKLRITVDGTVYDVEVEVAEPERPPIPSFASIRGGAAPVAAPRVSSGGGNDSVPDELACRSPLAGVVSSISTKAGDVVEQDQPLLVLEAMKMLTTITSPRAGTIKEIPVAVGDGVKQAQLLVEFEA